MELMLVSLASLLAGFVDSIVGGGGLVLVPRHAPLWMVYALIATGMVTYGSMAMLVMARAKWGAESTLH